MTRADTAAWAALAALHAEGWWYIASVCPTRAQVELSRGSDLAIESRDTLALALLRCAQVLRIEDHHALVAVREGL